MSVKSDVHHGQKLSLVHSVSRARVLRHDLQRHRARLLADLSDKHASNSTIVEHALDLLGEAYDGCTVSYQQTHSGTVDLSGEGRVPLADFQMDVWENTNYVEEYIRDKNQAPQSASNRTVRAIACRIDSDHHLVLSASTLRAILDDETDALFVRSVAMLIAKTQQDEALRQAVSAKESFLRNVQHSLRTSLNGILSASEMLLDDVSSDAEAKPIPGLPLSRSSNLTDQVDLLSIIDSSGRGLLAIINNLLRFQTTTETIVPKMEVCNLSDLEEQVLEAIIQECPRDKLAKVAIISDNRLDAHTDVLLSDRLILRQILAILIKNAVDATDDGSVEISFDRSPAGALLIDVVDTGRGIPMVSSRSPRLLASVAKIFRTGMLRDHMAALREGRSVCANGRSRLVVRQAICKKPWRVRLSCAERHRHGIDLPFRAAEPYFRMRTPST